MCWRCVRRVVWWRYIVYDFVGVVGVCAVHCLSTVPLTVFQYLCTSVSKEGASMFMFMFRGN